MKTKTRLILLAVASTFLLISAFKPKCKTADLAVLSIEEPTYESDIKGTQFIIEIKNLGKKTSDSTSLLAFDLDIGVDEIIASGYDSLIIDLVAENNARAKYYGKNNDSKWYDVDSNEYDYDFYWERMVDIPPLQPGQKHTIVITINDYWIYDSNCEIRVIIDPEKKTKDCNRNNNQKDFFAWG